MKSKKIFIVEDDVNILYSLQAKFRVKGVKIETSRGIASSEEVLEKIKKFNPNFIILDLILPNIDGFDFIKIIKETQEVSQIPIFIFTNLGDQDSKNKVSNLGANYFFVKRDFNIDEFVEKVNKIIENRKKVGK